MKEDAIRDGDYFKGTARTLEQKLNTEAHVKAGADDKEANKRERQECDISMTVQPNLMGKKE